MVASFRSGKEKVLLTAVSHRRRADRLAFLLKTAGELDRFSPDDPHDRLLRHVHRGIGPILGADLGFVWRLRRGCQVEAVYHWSWTGTGKNLLKKVQKAPLQELALAFAADQKSPGDRNLLLSRIEARGRPVGVFAFLRPGRPFGRTDAAFVKDASEVLGRQLDHREREKIFEIRERIVRKVLLQLRPTDLLYQVLHGLKRLFRYDHSASVHTIGRTTNTLTTRAEVIAWTKGKSVRIGQRLVLTPEMLDATRRMEKCVLFDPAHSTGAAPEPLLEHLAEAGPGAPPTRSLLLAPLRQQDDVVGLLAIRWQRPGAFASSDRETIDSFLHIISATALHSEFFRHQQNRLYEAERRTALGDLARAISHDLSNAFGVIQPLLETLRCDATEGRVTAENLLSDLETLDQYVRASLRIFNGLLSFSRGEVEEAQPIDVVRSIESVLLLLERGLRTARIEVIKEFAPGVPRLHARRQELEQLFLNLITNARESMPQGGHLTLRVWSEGQGREETIRISVADSGQGIPPELLSRIFEPFFSTKHRGTGLGLDICRSIVWEYHGTLQIESEVGRGTVAQIRFPVRGLPPGVGNEEAPS